jgi:hypothetical protein
MRQKKTPAGVTIQDILGYLSENAGRKFTASQLAKMYCVKTESVRDLLNLFGELELQRVRFNGYDYFYIPKEVDASGLSALMRFKINRPFKPLVLPKHFGKRIGDD